MQKAQGANDQDWNSITDNQSKVLRKKQHCMEAILAHGRDDEPMGKTAEYLKQIAIQYINIVMWENRATVQERQYCSV